MEYYLNIRWIRANELKFILERLAADMILINFLYPIPSLFQYLQATDIKLVYALHDHHVIRDDVANSWHLHCEVSTADWKPNPGFSRILEKALVVSTPSLNNQAIFGKFFPSLKVLAVPNRSVSYF